MNVLVTGGAGFIGSHVCVELILQGHKVIVLDNLFNSEIKSLSGISEITEQKINLDIRKTDPFTFIRADIKDKVQIERIFKFQKIDSVIHLAGLKSVEQSVKNSKEYYLNNVQGTVNLIAVMKKFNCKRIVFSSSATVYGNVEKVPIDEDTKLKPTNPYGENKKEIEEILQNIFNLDNSWGVAILRFFNPIGAHHSGIIGERLNQLSSNLMPYIIRVANNESKVLKIYGNDYETYDGTGVRDYVHVLDITSGHIRALEALTKKSQIFKMNLGTGVGYSVLDIVGAFEKASGKKIKIKIVKRREGDAAISIADSSYAESKLGWKAKYNLSEMCRDSWNYNLKNNVNI